MTRYLVTGAGGMLGRELAVQLADRDVALLGRHDLDVTDLAQVVEAVKGCDVIINAAAFTNVDEAELDEAAAFAVNATGADNIARAAASVGAVLVHMSTDYVFDGQAKEPYGEDAEPNPLSAYGRSKAEGERRAVLANPEATIIVRSAWLYSEFGSGFPATMLRLASQQPTIAVVTDQIGQPTWARDLAARIVELLDAGIRVGTFHATNTGQASWYEFARAVLALAGLDADRVTPSTSAEFARPAPRPAYSALEQSAWKTVNMSPMRPWGDALAEAFSSGALGKSS